jgi:hypothetical protein
VLHAGIPCDKGFVIQGNDKDELLEQMMLCGTQLHGWVNILYQGEGGLL